MKEIIVTVSVKIDEKNISKKFPNFDMVFNTTDEGLKEFAKRSVFVEWNPKGVNKEIDELGTSSRIIKVEDTDSIEYQRTQNILDRYDNEEYWEQEEGEGYNDPTGYDCDFINMALKLNL